MTSTRSAARTSRRPADKFEERRQELADATLHTLTELGYARTTLREIAQNSAFSHGVLHYYFRDKVELITYCVRRYKAQCVERYDRIAATATDPQALVRDAAEGLVAVLEQEAPANRLWYDLRAQSMFEPSFQTDVAEIDASLERMIWRVVTTYADLLDRTPACTRGLAYAAFDGLFYQALVRHLAGDAAASDDLRTGVASLLEQLV